MNATASSRRGGAATPGWHGADGRGQLVRRAVSLAGAALAVAGVALLAPSAASAADPGVLHLYPTSGSTVATPFATWSADLPCPADFRTGGSVVLVNADTKAVANVGGTFVPTANPPSGSMSATVSLATAMDVLHLASGDHQIVVNCANDDYSANVYADVVTIHVDLAAGTWNVVENGGNPSPVTTTTELRVQPTSAVAGDDVALTATVTGDGAAGAVEFFDGATSLGTASVSGGHASKTVNTLAVGQHSLAAKFEPTDANAFTPSTSDPVVVTIASAGGGGQSDGETLHVTIPEGPGGGGELTLAVGDGPVALTQVSGGSLEFKGNLSPVTVTDGRDQLAGWDVTGSTTDFTGGGHTLDGKWLGWTPEVTSQNQAHDVLKGSAVTPGDLGLKQVSTLGSAAADKGAGTCTLGGELDLQVPPETAAGDYSATLTITLMSK